MDDITIQTFDGREVTGRAQLDGELILVSHPKPRSMDVIPVPLARSVLDDRGEPVSLQSLVSPVPLRGWPQCNTPHIAHRWDPWLSLATIEGEAWHIRWCDRCSLGDFVRAPVGEEVSDAEEPQGRPAGPRMWLVE